MKINLKLLKKWGACSGGGDKVESFSDQIEEIRAKRINQVYQDLMGCSNGLRSIAKALNIPEILYADDQPLDPVLNAILEEIKILKNKLQNGIKGEWNE